MTDKKKYHCVVCSKYYLEKIAENKNYQCCKKKMHDVSEMEKHLQHGNTF